jgi:hypothetical protein
VICPALPPRSRNDARSGWRTATRTRAPSAARRFTISRPRNPEPPNTVTRLEVMSDAPGDDGCEAITSKASAREADQARSSVQDTQGTPAPRRPEAHHRPPTVARSRRRTIRSLDGLFRLSGCIPPERTTTRTSRPVIPVLALGKRSGERCNCFPAAWIRNVQEITGEVQEHPPAGGRHKAPAGL